MPDRPALDPINLDILKRLSQQGRIPLSTLASTLHRSTNAVRDRVAALERRGVILGYRAVIDDGRLGYDSRAMIFVEADPAHRGPPTPHDAWRIPGVRRICRAVGPYAVAVEAVGTDEESLLKMVREQIYPLGYRRARILFLGHDLLAEGMTPLESGPEPQQEGIEANLATSVLLRPAGLTEEVGLRAMDRVMS